VIKKRKLKDIVATLIVWIGSGANSPLDRTEVEELLEMIDELPQSKKG